MRNKMFELELKIRHTNYIDIHNDIDTEIAPSRVGITDL